ncbi:MAG: winged helix-turn-helix transcriptional regulator [Rhodospirillaceae bacterium]|nr:winged helix-turn-helix transcriptional regulator [Rhodospirillaceae bacterium]MBT6139149.1 winged helix-turn-helix transcriptional regulator [Rhodospirillaceae bacterium]
MQSQEKPDPTNPSELPGGDNKRLILEDFIPYRLSVLSNTVSRTIARLYSDQFDITILEWRVMAVIGSFGPMSANEICQNTEMDKVQVSRATTKLIESGRLARKEDETDRRRFVLSLTAGGRQTYDEIVPIAKRSERRLLDVLTSEETQRLSILLSKLQIGATRLNEVDGS